MTTLLERLKLHEGCKKDPKTGLHIPYKDTVGATTIGYGALIDPEIGGGLDEQEAEFILQHRANKALQQAQKFDWFPKLGVIRQEVVVEMIFNLGLSKFNQFVRFQKALEDGDYDRAADEMKDSKWYRQIKSRGVTLEGLMRRGYAT